MGQGECYLPLGCTEWPGLVSGDLVRLGFIPHPLNLYAGELPYYIFSFIVQGAR